MDTCRTCRTKITSMYDNTPREKWVHLETNDTHHPPIPAKHKLKTPRTRRLYDN
jgi:hypothetical protein